MARANVACVAFRAFEQGRARAWLGQDPYNAVSSRAAPLRPRLFEPPLGAQLIGQVLGLRPRCARAACPMPRARCVELCNCAQFPVCP